MDTTIKIHLSDNPEITEASREASLAIVEAVKASYEAARQLQRLHRMALDADPANKDLLEAYQRNGLGTMMKAAHIEGTMKNFIEHLPTKGLRAALDAWKKAAEEIQASDRDHRAITKALPSITYDILSGAE